MKKRTNSEIDKNEHIPIWKQITAAIFIVLGAFLFIAILFDATGPVGNIIKTVLKGLLGTGSLIVPLLFMYLAVWTVTNSTKIEFSMKFWSGFVTIVSFSIVMYLISNNNSEIINIKAMSNLKLSDVIVLLFDNGNKNFISGGVLGGIGIPLELLFDKIGTGIIIGLILLVSFMLLTGITLIQIFRSISPVKIKEIAVSIGEMFSRQNKLDKIEKVIKDDEPIPIVLNIPSVIDIPVDEFVPSREPQVDDIIGALHIEEKDNISKKSNSIEKTVSDIPDGQIKVVLKNSQEALYNYPPISLLAQNTAFVSSDVSDELRINAKKLVDTLSSFGVEAKVMNISRGPSVTRYELSPGSGVKISKIANLADDLALNLAALGVRIEAPIPGKAAVGIEVPNKNVGSVFIRELLSSKEFMDAKSQLTVCLGKDITGNHIVADLSKMPHLLIAGATGSGKSVCINSLIISLLYKSSPEHVKLLMIDPKVVELRIYNSIPHLLIPVVTDAKKAYGALAWAVTEMLNRYKLFSEQNVRDLIGYNELAKVDSSVEPLPQIVIIIDELADLMMVSPNEVEDAICRLAQMARAAGMHLVIATQRPSVDVITGTIKANIPSRIAFSVSSTVDSRIILDMSGAEKLIGRGDMLFSPVGIPKPMRIQGCFVSDKEVELVTNFVKRSKDDIYDDEIISQIDVETNNNKRTSSSDVGDDDLMLPQAIECIVEAGIASVSFLQRRLKLGYARAARIMDEMEARGIVGPFEGSKPRKVLISRQQWQEMIMSNDN